MAVLSMVAGLPLLAVHASVYQASAESVAPQWINAGSRPVAVIGLNLSQNSGERLLSIEINFTDVGADGRFNSSDLAPLAADGSSGVALYIDNKTGSSLGEFESDDLWVPLSSVPQWTYGAGELSTLLSTGGTSIPANDLGNNTGSDFFVVIRTSGSPAGGDDFTVSLGPGDVRTDNGPLDFAPVQTAPIVFDIASPRADGGPDAAVDEGVETGFSAAASTDNVGIANYSWTFGDFGPGYQRYGVYVTYTFNSPGRFLVLLNAMDYAGNSDESILLVTVRNLNQPPVIISSPNRTAKQGTPYVYLLQAYDNDADALQFSVVNGPEGLSINSSNGLVLWVPGPRDSGSVPVNLSVTDGKSLPVRQNFRIDVQSVNNPPEFVSFPVGIATQGKEYYYKAEARDPDNNQLTYSLVAGPRGMTVGPYTGDVKWTPQKDQVGLNRVVLSASDRNFTVYQDFSINVTNANDIPVISSQPSVTALQGIPYTYQVLAYDPDGDEIWFRLNTAPIGMVIGSRSGLVSWTPSSDQVGYNQVIVEVTDLKGDAAPQSFWVNVVNVNDPPRIESGPPATARQGAPFTYYVQVFDPDGDPVELSLLSKPPGMTINSSSRLIAWVPGQESVGRVSVTVLASDGLGGIGYQEFDLTVLDTNDAPVKLGDIPDVAFQNQVYAAQVRAYDPDGDALTYALVSPPDVILDRYNGTLVWLPTIAQNVQIDIRITDENGTSIDALFNVTVRPSPEPPVVAPIGLLHARVGEPFRYTVDASDPNDDRLRFSVTTGLFSINSTSGLISFSPGEGDVGAHEFTVDVRDATGLNTTVSGVLVVDAEAGGLSLPKIAGFGLAGIGGADPRLILAITLLMGCILFYEYARLRRREARERPAEEALLAEEAKRLASRGVTEEERAALFDLQKRERDAEALAEREAPHRAGAAEEAGNKEMLERKAREWDAALREQRAARELREREEAEKRSRELSEKRARERSQAEEMEKKALELKEREEAERRAVLQSIQNERKVLSKEEQERLEREIELELAESGLGGLDDDDLDAPPDSPPPDEGENGAAAPRKKVAPKRTPKRD